MKFSKACRRIARLVERAYTNEAVKEYRFLFLIDEWIRRHPKQA